MAKLLECSPRDSCAKGVTFGFTNNYLLTLDSVLTRVGMEYMDYLMPDISDQQGVLIPLRPMPYATALKWLRHCIRAPWKKQQSTLLDPAVFTIHSCKATLLSWLTQGYSCPSYCNPQDLLGIHTLLRGATWKNTAFTLTKHVFDRTN